MSLMKLYGIKHVHTRKYLDIFIPLPAVSNPIKYGPFFWPQNSFIKKIQILRFSSVRGSNIKETFICFGCQKKKEKWVSIL